MAIVIEDRIDEAIKYMDEARESHQLWVEWYEKTDVAHYCRLYPDADEDTLHDLAGDKEHNQKWVDRYDKTIKVLQDLKGK